MSLIYKLKSRLESGSPETNNLFVRTRLKEVLQDYVLNFVYNHPRYQQLIFTGGTCLRKAYGLPRLSEDLDFDYSKKFDIQNFAADVIEYFNSRLQYGDAGYKISGREQSVFFKFPVLGDLGLTSNQFQSKILFLRCDFSLDKWGKFGTEVNQISTDEYSFFAKCYDLPTLFANKIIAFLTRKFFKGKEQALAFKGRDVFDLAWLMEQSALQGFKLQPNWPRLKIALGLDKAEVKKMWLAKIRKIDPQDVVRDLSPFIQSTSTITNFSQNLRQIFEAKLKFL